MAKSRSQSVVPEVPAPPVDPSKDPTEGTPTILLNPPMRTRIWYRNTVGKVASLVAAINAALDGMEPAKAVQHIKDLLTQVGLR